MKSLLTLSAASLLLIGGIASCSLEERINDLDDRVSTLEKQIQDVKSDMSSLQEIVEKLQSSVTINNIVEDENGYTINFSDGTSVTITNGSDGVTPPTITVMEIDGEYYWGLEYPDGSMVPVTDGEGNNIPVTGGMPDIRINPQTGNWEISTDGEHWNDTGMPSTGKGDSIFLGVTEDEDNVYFELRGGTIITVPKTKELIFDFGTEEEVLTFSRGESKTLENYRMSGAEKVTITKPDGWKASIESEGFVITAPVAANEFAETEGMISVILFSANGQSFLAEQKVLVEEGFASGSGTAEDPYMIGDAAQFTLMAEKVNSGDSAYIKAHYALDGDIDLSGIEWQPIGAGLGNTELELADKNGFGGTFNGNGHKITGLTINARTEAHIGIYGLFGLCLSGASITDLNVEGNIEAVNTGAADASGATSMMSVGGIVGSGTGIALTGCSFTGSVKSRFENNPNSRVSVGGIIGNLTGNLESCSATVPESSAISAYASYPIAGALAGYVNAGLITMCDVNVLGDILAECPEYATNAMSPTAIAGGIVGSSFGGSIGTCEASVAGDITALCEYADSYDIGSALAGGISGSYAADMLGNNTVEVSGNITAKGTNSALAGGAIGSQNNAGYGASNLAVTLSGSIYSETFGEGMADAAYSGGIYGKASYQMGGLSDSYSDISGSITAKSTVFAGVGGVVGTSTEITRCWAICRESSLLDAQAVNVDAVVGGIAGIVASGNITGSYSILDGKLNTVSTAGNASIGGIDGAMTGNMMRAKAAIGCYSLSNCTATSSAGTAAMNGALVGLSNRNTTLNTCFWYSNNDTFTGHSGAEGASDIYRLADRETATLENAAAAMNEILIDYNSRYTYDSQTGWLTVSKIE